MTTINTTNSLVEKVQGLAIDMDLTHEFVQGNENQTVLLGGVPTPTVRKLVKDIDIRESKAAQTVINSAKSQITSEGNKQTDRVLTTGNEQNTRVATTGQVEYDRLIKTGNEQNKRVTDTGDAQNARVYNTGQTQYTNINTMANEQYSKIVTEGGQQVSKINTTGQTQYERLLATGSNERKQLVIIGDEQTTRLTTIVDNSRDELSVYVKEASDHADTAEEAAQRALDMTGVGYASKNNYGICRVGDGIDVDDGVLSVKQQIIISTPVITFPAIVGLGFAYELTMSAETIIPGAHIDHFEVTFGDDPKIDVPAEGDKASVMLTPHGASGVVRRITVTAKDTVGSTSLDGVTTYTQNTVSIAAPRVLFPVDNDVEISLTPTISLQPATITGVSGTPSKTHLQISKTDLFGDDDIVFDTGVVDYKTNIEVPMGSLTIVSNYFIRAKHEFEKYGESAWGQVSRFTTLEAYVNKPSILSPVNGSIDVALQTLFSMSSYATTGLPYVHTGRELRIYKPDVVDPVFTYSVPLAVPNTYTLPVALDLQAPFQAEIEDTGVFNAETSVAVSDRISFVTVNAYIVKPKILTMNTDIQNVLTMNPFSNIGPVDNLKERVVRYYDATSDTLLHTYHIIPSDQLNFTMPLADVLEFGGSYKVTVEDEGFIWGFSGESDPMLLNTMNPVVAKPVITFPTNGSVDVSLQPTFTFSTYSCDTPGVQLRERRIGLLQPYGEWNESLVSGDIWTPTAALPLLTKMTAKLTDVGTYKGRDIIVVSDVMTFTTVYALPVKPSIVVPVEGAKIPSKPATFVMTYETEPQTSIVQEASEWVVKSGERVAATSGVTTTALGKWEIDLTEEVKKGPPVFLPAVTTPGQTSSWLGITHGNGVWVVCGDRGKISRSTDNGITWSNAVAIPGQTYIWYDIDHGNGVFVMCGDGGMVSRSTNDGVTWSNAVVTPGQTSAWRDVSYANGVWIICGIGGKVSRSTDNGATWSNAAATPGQINAWLGTAYGNGVWVVCGEDGRISRSTDNGITWSTAVAIPGKTSAWWGIAYANGVWVVCGLNGRISRSTDNGITWSTAVAIPGQTSAWLKIAHVNGVWVICGYNGKVSYSTDNGVTWSPAIVTPGQTGVWYGVAYGNGVWIICGDYGKLSRSTDGETTWSAAVAIPGQISPWRNVSYANGIWVICGDGGMVTRSTDNGVIWSNAVATPGQIGTWWGVSYANGVWIVCGHAGKISRSTDNGVTWSAVVVTPGQTGIWRSAAHANGVWILCGEGGAVSRSTDNGTTWSTAVAIPGQVNYWYGIAYANGVWVVCGQNGKVSRSTDNGVTWSNAVATPGQTSAWRGAAYANGVWIVCGEGGKVTRSTDDGVTWLTAVTTPGQPNTWWSVAYGNGVWIVCGDYGRISRSTDNGITWSNAVVTPGQPSGWCDMAYGNSVWVLCGDGSKVSYLPLRESSPLTIAAKNKPTGLPWSEPSDPVTFTVQG